MKQIPKFFVTASFLLFFVPSSVKAVVEVHNSSLDLLMKQQIAMDQTRTTALGNLNWMMGSVNAFYGQVGYTRQMAEDFLNSHGFGGSKVGKYASHVIATCIGDKFKSLSKVFKIPEVDVCGIDVAADLADYLGEILNEKINQFLKTIFSDEPQKTINESDPVPPGKEQISMITDKEVYSVMSNNNDIKIKDENGIKRTITISKSKSIPDGSKTYKDSTLYIVNRSLINSAPEDTLFDFITKASTGDKENLGNINSPEIRNFYGRISRHYTKVAKQHREQFLKNSYNLKRTEDFFNSTFVKNKDKNKADEFKIDIPIPVAKVVKTRKVGNEEEGGCLFTADDKAEKLGDKCYNITYDLSFLDERKVVESPSAALKDYTKGLRDISKKIISKLVSKETAKRVMSKFNIEKKIENIKKEDRYKESGINFATISELITFYTDTATKLYNYNSPDGRDMAKINYLKSILYQLTLLNHQLYLYNRVKNGVETDRYEEIYYHVLNIEKELLKIRKYETFFLRKILLK